MTPVEATVALLVAAGVFFVFVGAVGLIRLPDVYTRAHASSKADTLGAGFALAAVALSFGFTSHAVKTALLLIFVYVSSPTAAHAISRAAYRSGVEPWTADDRDGGGGR